jgi:hypothetical protein
MAGRNQGKLTKAQVEAFLMRLNKEAPRPECRLCECMQGFLAQLELDAAEDAKPLAAGQRTSTRKTHRCLGCEPCPPAAIFAEYLMRKRGR